MGNKKYLYNKPAILPDSMPRILRQKNVQKKHASILKIKREMR
jgi:hypothetical protein